MQSGHGRLPGRFEVSRCVPAARSASQRRRSSEGGRAGVTHREQRARDGGSRGANLDTRGCVSVAASRRPRAGSSGHDPRDRASRSSAAGQTIRRSSLGCSRGAGLARGRGALGSAAGVGRRRIAGSHGCPPWTVCSARVRAGAGRRGLGGAGRQAQAFRRRPPHRRGRAALERSPRHPCARAATRAHGRAHGSTGAAYRPSRHISELLPQPGITGSLASRVS